MAIHFLKMVADASPDGMGKSAVGIFVKDSPVENRFCVTWIGRSPMCQECDGGDSVSKDG